MSHRTYLCIDLKSFYVGYSNQLRIIVSKIELSEKLAEELNRKMLLLQRGQIASVVYFHRDEYIKITGMVARIDNISRLLQIVNTKIPFEDILDVDINNS